MAQSHPGVRVEVVVMDNALGVESEQVVLGCANLNELRHLLFSSLFDRGYALRQAMVAGSRRLMRQPGKQRRRHAEYTAPYGNRARYMGRWLAFASAVPERVVRPRS